MFQCKSTQHGPMPTLCRRTRSFFLLTAFVALAAVLNPAALSAQETGDSEMVDRIVFREESLDQVLSLLERLKQKSIIRPQALPGVTITFNSQQPLTREEAILAITSLLSINGIGITPMGDKFIRVVPLARVRQQSPEFITVPASTLPSSGHFVSRMIPLSFLRIEEVQPQLAQLSTPDGGSIIQFPKANAILVTDTISNLQAMEDIIERMDRPFAPALEPKFFKLEHARANDVVARIQGLTGTPAGQSLGAGTQLFADERTNQVILLSDPRQVEYFEKLITQLDIRSEPLSKPEIIPLKHADSIEVAGLLSQLVSGRSVAGGAGRTGAGTQARPSGTVGPGVGGTGQQTRPGTQRGTQQTRPSTQQPRQGTQQRLPMPQLPGQQTGTRTRAQQASEGGGGGETGGTPAAGGEAATGVAGDGSADFSEFVTVLPEPRSNAVIISGTPQDLELLRDLVRQLDVLLAQVRIEVFIAEVTLSDQAARGLDSFGINFTEGSNTVGFDATGRGFGVSRTAGGVWEAAFNAAASKSNIKILSVPTIVTTHNREARILVGERRPVITGTITDGSFQSSIRSQIQFQDIGIELTVLPLIGSDGTIQMEITQTVDDVVGEIPIDGNDQPIIGTREATSFVSVFNRETIILGGLQSSTRRRGESRIGIFGQMPLIGPLFGTRSREDNRTELLVFIRPTVLGTTGEAHADAQEQLRQLSQRDSLGRVMDPVLEVVEDEERREDEDLSWLSREALELRERARTEPRPMIRPDEVRRAFPDNE